MDKSNISSVYAEFSQINNDDTLQILNDQMGDTAHFGSKVKEIHISFATESDVLLTQYEKDSQYSFNPLYEKNTVIFGE